MVSLLFGGALNQLALGLQIYIWVILAMVIMLVALNVAFYVFFEIPLKPLMGLFDAYIHNLSVVFTFDKNLHFKLRSESAAKLVFEETIGAARKAQKVWDYSPSGNIGKTSADLIFDEGRWTEIGSPAREEIDKAIVLWNENNPDDEVHTLIRFGKLLHEGRIQCPIDKEIIVPWLRIRSAFTPKTVGSYAGYKRQLARNLQKSDVANYNNMGYVILIFAGVVCAGMIAAKALHLV